MYNNLAAIIIAQHVPFVTYNARDLVPYHAAEPQHVPGPVIYILSPVLSMPSNYYDVLERAAAPLWPPPLPTNPGIPGIYSAIKPGVYNPLSEGFQGGGR